MRKATTALIASVTILAGVSASANADSVGTPALFGGTDGIINCTIAGSGKMGDNWLLSGCEDFPVIVLPDRPSSYVVAPDPRHNPKPKS
jgi:hypothetical protein